VRRSLIRGHFEMYPSCCPNEKTIWPTLSLKRLLRWFSFLSCSLSFCLRLNNTYLTYSTRFSTPHVTLSKLGPNIFLSFLFPNTPCSWCWTFKYHVNNQNCRSFWRKMNKLKVMEEISFVCEISSSHGGDNYFTRQYIPEDKFEQ
jgi:hypothetical protein